MLHAVLQSVHCDTCEQGEMAKWAVLTLDDIIEEVQNYDSDVVIIR